MALRVYLIRHGETDFNKRGKEWGQPNNASLNEIGIIQSKRLTKKIKNIKFDKLFSSDLKRALQTAKIVSKALGITIIKDGRLREYNPGKVNPSSEKWIKEYKRLLHLGMSKYDIRPFGGENIWDLIKRVKSFLKDLEKETGTIAIISHSGVNSTLINLSQGKEKDNFLGIKQDNGCINILDFIDEKWKIITINDSRHIDGIKPKKMLYKNQKEIKDIAKKYLLSKLSNIGGKLFIGGDIAKKEFGVYTRIYKKYRGSPIECYLLFRKKLEIPKEWKISSILDGIKKYEIGEIKIGEIKHKVNLTIIKDKSKIKEKNLERIR
jgi:broad specificity phosphatase PhoE